MANIFHHTHAFVKKHKKYHHYFLLTLIAISGGFYMYNKAVHVHAATYNFSQSSWAGGVSANTVESSHITDWTNFSATSSTSVLASAGGVSLAPVSYSFVDDGATSTTPTALTTGGGFANGIFSDATTTSGNASVGLSVGSALATGGMITTSGEYVIHTFCGTVNETCTSGSGNFILNTPVDVEYLVVGGGGGAAATGIYPVGSGGAGGFRTGTLLNTSSGTYSVVAGAGGAGGSSGTDGFVGVTSSALSVSASGGGYGGGGGSSGRVGGSGGSGGGGGFHALGGSGNTPSTSPSQGNSGNTVAVNGWNKGGGAGSNGTNGGSGLSSSISGVSVVYAAGGATAAAGGSGLANSGNGGDSRSGGGSGGSGGSGIVILRYKSYVASGIVTSAVINTGKTKNLTSISFASTTPSLAETSCTATTGVGCAIKIQIATSSSANGPWSYLGPDGTSATYFTSKNTTVNTTAFDGAQYIKYQATLSTANPTVTPTLDNVTIGYSQYPASGDLTSSKYDTGSDANLINNITWSALDNNGGVLDGGEEAVKFQIRSASTSSLLDSASWCGSSLTCDGTSYFTTSTGIVGGLTAGHPLKTGGDDRWFQYRAFLTSGGDLTPVLSNVIVQYVVNASPDFNSSYGTNGVSVYENATSTDANWGKTMISYAIKDIDGDTGSATPNYVAPSFEYSVDGGSNWYAIASSTLTYVAPSNGGLARYVAGTGTSTLSGPYTGGVGAGVVLNSVDTSSYRTYTVLWNASNSTTTETSNAKIRVTINDNEASSNTATAQSSAFTLDTKAPTGGITFDAGVAGVTNGANVYIGPSDATSTVQYLITEGNSSASPVSTGWVSTTTGATTTIHWTFDSDIEAKSLKFQFRDAYGNTTATTTLTTVDPIPLTTFIVQDTSSVLSTPPSHRMYIGWQVSTSTSFADYELEYATSTDNVNFGTYTEVAELLNVNTAYYVHTNLNADYFYRYRLGIRDTAGNITVRPSSYVMARPDGIQNYGEGGGGTSASVASPVVRNIFPEQPVNSGNVTVAFNLIDENHDIKLSPSYEAYVFYDNGITIPSSLSTNPTSIVVSDSSRMPSSGYVQIDNEVFGYTSNSTTTNTLSGITTSTWPTVGTSRVSAENTAHNAYSTVWIKNASTTPVTITATADITSTSTGQNVSIVWDTAQESSLIGYSFENVGIRVLVHDNQAAEAEPLSTQNTASSDGKLVFFRMGSPDDTPFAINNDVTVANIQSNQVTITWTTTKFATSTVEFTSPDEIGGAFPSFSVASSTTSINFAVEQSITLDNLRSDSEYTFKVKSTNILGTTTGTTLSDNTEYHFTTRGGPRILYINQPQETRRDTGATIVWYTDKASNSKLRYSKDVLTVNSVTASSSFEVSGNVATVATTTGEHPNYFYHQVDVSELTPNTRYYFKVTSELSDATGAIDTAYSSTDDNKNPVYPFLPQYHQMDTIGDENPPVISSVSVPVRSSNSAVIVWSTNEDATSQVYWGTSTSTMTHYTEVDAYPTKNHSVTITSATDFTNTGLSTENKIPLLPKTTYYFRVASQDFASPVNSTSTVISDTNTFTTTEDGVVVIQQVSAGGSASNQPSDTTPPVIVSYTADEKTVGAFNADVSVTTSEPVRAFVTYGETTDYGQIEGDNILSTSKVIHLKKLKTGTGYHYRVQVMDKAGNDVTSADGTFKTKFVSELLDNRTTLDKADELQGQIEQLLESALPSLSPPYVSKPEISNITESGASITWNTNIKTIGTLSYATDEEYASSSDKYALDVSAEADKASTHTVELVNLKPNTKYHIQARSYVFPQVTGKSPDMTFVTKAAKVKADVLEKKKDGFTVAWTTDEPTTSIVEYKNQKTGEINRTTDATKKTYHAVKIENLPSATTFTVKVSGTNANDNLIEAADSLDVTTSSDTTPPVISNFKVDNALVPGRTDRIQTVVGWQTDEPANAVVYYEEGAGTPGDTKELANKVESLDSYTANHIMILASLKPGAIYRIKVISTDESGNTTTFGPRTIITPRQTESVLDIIFKNFEDTFKFLRK